jgi:hypothetical protein
VSFGDGPNAPRYPRASTYLLFRWLTERENRNDYNRVVRLIADIKRLTKIVHPKRQCLDRDDACYGINLPKRGYSTREWAALIARISMELKRHKSFPELDHFRNGTWRVNWLWNEKKSSRRVALRERPVTATDAALEIVRAAEFGYLEAIRQCRRCGKWFLAGLKTQVYCLRECQRQAYWSDPRWKAHRRAYMRKYRRIKSLPNIK